MLGNCDYCGEFTTLTQETRFDTANLCGKCREYLWKVSTRGPCEKCRNWFECRTNCKEKIEYDKDDPEGVWE